MANTPADLIGGVNDEAFEGMRDGMDTLATFIEDRDENKRGFSSLDLWQVVADELEDAPTDVEGAAEYNKVILDKITGEGIPDLTYEEGFVASFQFVLQKLDDMKNDPLEMLMAGGYGAAIRGMHDEMIEYRMEHMSI